jgi:uncharacterized membrane protein YfhO
MKKNLEIWMKKHLRFIASLLFPSFLVPFSLLGFVLFLFDIFPFGERTLLVSDMSNQYIQFYSYLYDVFVNGKSLLYSWEAGMGLNFLGIFAYYLSSPFSLLIIFFERSHLTEAIVFITLCKIGFSGLTMSYYLHYLFRLNKINIIMFSTMYALMGYNIVYSFNLMWLDGIYLLPLILLGIEKLLTSKRLVFFTFSLTISFLSNFYISYMVGLFAFCYFLIRFFTFCKEKICKNLTIKFLHFSISTIIAVGLSSFLLLPTYLILKHHGNTTIMIPTSHSFSFPVLDLYAKLFHGVFDSLINGLPIVYIGILPLLLFPLFFWAKQIRFKEKVLFGILFLMTIFTFEIPILNLVWHGFDTPNWFPFRYSFIFSFLILYLSIRVFKVLDKEHKSILFKIYLVNILLLILLQKLSPHLIKSNDMLINIILLTSYFILLLIKIEYQNKKRIINTVLAFIVCLEVSTNSWIMINEINGQFGYLTKGDYNIINPDYTKLIKKVQKQDHSFYRMELNRYRTLNDPMRYDYKGITHYSSMANVHLHSFLYEIGYTTLDNYYWVSNNGSTLITNALFSQKYLITDGSSQRFGYQKIDQIGNVSLYKNLYSLSVGFMVNKTNNINKNIKDNPFLIQNQLIGAKVFEQIQPLKTDYSNLEINKQKNKIILTKKDLSKEAFLNVKLKVPKHVQLYMMMQLHHQTKTNIYVNNLPLGAYPHVYNNRILGLGLFNRGDIVNVKIELTGEEMVINDIMFYAINLDLFESKIDELKEHSLDVTHWSSREIHGNINVNKDGWLFLSIPYDRGWDAKVNGQTREIINLYDSLIAIPLNKGKHYIELSYTPPGFKVGLFITSVSLITFTWLLLYEMKKRKL